MDEQQEQHHPGTAPGEGPGAVAGVDGPPGGPVPTTAELRLMIAAQRALSQPATVRTAQLMSLAGEHAAVWIAGGALGALVDAPRRRRWVAATATVVAAHGASVVVKRLTRRVRPSHPHVQVRAGTPSRWSLPSSHATSTTAAAVAFGTLVGRGRLAPLVPAMALSRIVVGVHYPSDVAAGSALGALVALAGQPVAERLLGERRA